MKKFTLIELLLVTFILALMASSALLLVDTQDDQVRYDETKKRLETIRLAIIGQNVDPNDPSTYKGYFYDTGEWPESIDSLIASDTPSALTDYEFNANLAYATGWRGPYISTLDANFGDGWGNEFETSGLIPELDTITITSRGANEVSGGVNYDKDLEITINKKAIEDGLNSSKYQKTIDRLNEIRLALIGSETQVNNQPVVSGYLADVGNVPNSISDLISKDASISDWEYNEALGFGFGWRGPYINHYNNNYGDAWGTDFKDKTNNINWDGPESNGDLIISSYGADQSSGGSDYDNDITMTIDKNRYRYMNDDTSSFSINFSITLSPTKESLNLTRCAAERRIKCEVCFIFVLLFCIVEFVDLSDLRDRMVVI